MHGKHSAKSHIAAMIGIGGLIFVGLLLTGRSASESLYLAAVLSCPVMMIGMMLMMRGRDHTNDHPADLSTVHGGTTPEVDRATGAAEHHHR